MGAATYPVDPSTADGAAAYTAGAAAYMRTVRLKLTPSSLAEVRTELGKICQQIFGVSRERYPTYLN